MIGRVILGLVIAAVGFTLVWKTEWYNANFGQIQWAEEKFGTSGGSRLMYKMIGTAALLMGFMVVTNLHSRFLFSVFGWLFPGVKPPEEDGL